MTAVATLAGAPCYDVVIDWNRINWKKINRNVRRLQARIVKAIEEVGQGESLAMAPDPLVQRESLGRETSDREPGQEDAGRRRRSLGCAPEEGVRDHPLAPARLSGTTTEEDVHTEKGW